MVANPTTLDGDFTFDFLSTLHLPAHHPAHDFGRFPASMASLIRSIRCLEGGVSRLVTSLRWFDLLVVRNPTCILPSGNRSARSLSARPNKKQEAKRSSRLQSG